MKQPFVPNTNPLKIGIMTYTIAKDWNIETIIRNLTEAGYQSVELRTTHAHGIEVTLSPSERGDVKNVFKTLLLRPLVWQADLPIIFLTLLNLKRTLRVQGIHILAAMLRHRNTGIPQ